MPPKKKLTKAEIERRKQEELERQRAEEAEKQRQAEEEEARKLEDQRRAEEEECKRQLAEEEARLNEQRVFIEKIFSEHDQALRLSADKKLKADEWSRYLSCNTLVDPRQATQVNSFINLWKERSAQKPVDEILSECEKAQEVLDAIKQIVSSDIESPCPEEKARYEEVTQRLQEVIIHKLNAVTLHALQTPNGYVDEETQNTIVNSRTGEITFRLWGNVAKNPRIKEVLFEKNGHFQLSLAKPLVVGNVAVRLVTLLSDNLSPKSQSYLPSLQKDRPVKNAPKASILLNEDLQKPPSSAQSSTSLTASPLPSKMGSRMVSSSNVERAISATDAEDTSGLEGDVEMTTEDEATDRPRSTKSPGNSKTASLTTSRTSLTGDSRVALQARDDDGDDDGYDLDEVDLRNYRPLGGVFCLDLFKLPSQPKVAGNWTVQDVGLSSIEVLPYPPVFKQKAPPTPAIQNEKKTEPKTAENEADTEAATQAALKEFNAAHVVHVIIGIPQGVVFFEEPKLARWDASTLAWRTDGYSNFVFDKETGVFSFDTSLFCPYTLMQDLYLNTPLAHWSLMPSAPEQLHITIATTFADLEFIIKGECCRLVKAKETKVKAVRMEKDDVSEKQSAKKKKDNKEEPVLDPTISDLSTLIGKAMSVTQLKEAMISVGMNIFPGVDGHKYISVSKKDRSLETAIYREIAILSRACGFHWSKYNEKAGPKQAVVQACQATNDNAEPQWSCFLLGENCWKLAAQEEMEVDKFTTDRAENCQAHATTFEAITRSLSSSIREEVIAASPGFVRAVFDFLEAIRPLVYS